MKKMKGMKFNKIKSAPSFHKSKMRGYIYTLEVLLSISLIIIIVVFAFKFTPNRDVDNMPIIKDRMFNALEYLDHKGDLRPIANSLDKASLDRNLTSLLTGLNYEFDICIDTCLLPGLPNEPVVSVEYYISGYQDSYSKKKIKVWAWRKF